MMRRRWLILLVAAVLLAALAHVWRDARSVVFVVVNDSRLPMGGVSVKAEGFETSFQEIPVEGSVRCRIQPESAASEIEISWFEGSVERAFLSHGQAGERVVVRFQPDGEPFVSRAPGLWLRLTTEW